MGIGWGWGWGWVGLVEPPTTRCCRCQVPPLPGAAAANQPGGVVPGGPQQLGRDLGVQLSGLWEWDSRQVQCGAVAGSQLEDVAP